MSVPASTPLDLSSVRTADQFAMGVIGPAELSHMTSKMALERATNPMAKEFAEFEFTEAVAIISVLKDLGATSPQMNANSQATVEKIQVAADGAAFDQAYMTHQAENHRFLRDLATAYLANSSADTTDMGEKHGRHLATVGLSTFKEHTTMSERISSEIKA